MDSEAPGDLLNLPNEPSEIKMDIARQALLSLDNHTPHAWTIADKYIGMGAGAVYAKESSKKNTKKKWVKHGFWMGKTWVKIRKDGKPRVKFSISILNQRDPPLKDLTLKYRMSRADAEPDSVHKNHD